VPFDTRLLDVALMDAGEIAWLNGYHERVAQVLGPLLEGVEKAWLKRATRAV
jgi:Xaa-Pro aminopeptidase